MWACLHQEGSAADAAAAQIAAPAQITIDTDVFLALLDHQFSVEVGVLTTISVLALVILLDL